MSAGYQDLFLEQGTTFNTQLTLNDVYGNPYDLTGYRIASQARRSYYSSNATITFATSIYNANTGTIILGLDSANSANVPTGTLLYDVIIKDSSNNVTRVLEGRVFVDPMITRPIF